MMLSFSNYEDVVVAKPDSDRKDGRCDLQYGFVSFLAPNARGPSPTTEHGSQGSASVCISTGSARL
jgi:hypothetical protein